MWNQSHATSCKMHQSTGLQFPSIHHRKETSNKAGKIKESWVLITTRDSLLYLIGNIVNVVLVQLVQRLRFSQKVLLRWLVCKTFSNKAFFFYLCPVPTKVAVKSCCKAACGEFWSAWEPDGSQERAMLLQDVLLVVAGTERLMDRIWVLTLQLGKTGRQAGSLFGSPSSSCSAPQPSSTPLQSSFAPRRGRILPTCTACKLNFRSFRSNVFHASSMPALLGRDRTRKYPAGFWNLSQTGQTPTGWKASLNEKMW